MPNYENFRFAPRLGLIVTVGLELDTVIRPFLFLRKVCNSDFGVVDDVGKVLADELQVVVILERPRQTQHLRL